MAHESESPEADHNRNAVKAEQVEVGVTQDRRAGKDRRRWSARCCW